MTTASYVDAGASRTVRNGRAIAPSVQTAARPREHREPALDARDVRPRVQRDLAKHGGMPACGEFLDVGGVDVRRYVVQQLTLAWVVFPHRRLSEISHVARQAICACATGGAVLSLARGNDSAMTRNSETDCDRFSST